MKDTKIHLPPPINDSPPPSRVGDVWADLRSLSRQTREDRFAEARRNGDAANMIVYARLLDELNMTVHALIVGRGNR